MAFCVGCGDTLSDVDQFCASCGRPAEGAKPADPSGATGVPAVSVPEWLTAGWGVSVAWALGAVLTGIVIMYAISVVLVVGLALSLSGDGIGLGMIDWGQQLKSPIFVWLGLHGAVSGSAMWLTSIAWIVAAFLITARFGMGIRTIADSIPSRIVSAAIMAGKTALVYASIVLVFLIVLDPGATSVGGNFASIGGSYLDWEPGGAFFSTLLVVFLATWGIRWWNSRVLSQERETGSVQQLVVAGFSGTWRILALSVFGLLAFGFVGFAIELLRFDLDVFSWLASVLMTFVVAFGLLAGLDIGMAMFASAMQFFRGDGLVADAVLGSPGWIIAGTVIVAAAFLWGGHRAARATGSVTLSRILQASGLAGLGVTAAFIVASIIMGGRIPEIRAGIGLSLLWTLVAVGGGLIHAQSVGALQEVMPESGGAAPIGAPVEKTCPTCSAALPADASFCAECGNAVD